MAPFVSLLALFLVALSTTVLASPHISRHVHRAVDIPRLNKRCTPRPDNTTSSPLPVSSAPVNVAPVPSASSLSGTPSSLFPTSSYTPPQPSNQPPSPTTSSTPPPPPTTTPPVPPPADTTSSTPPPPPTTSSTPPPPPTTSSTPPTTSTPPPAQTSASSGSSGEPSYLIGTQSGQGTFYSVGLGACGVNNIDADYIAAVSHFLFDSFPNYNGNPNDNPVCGKGIKITYQGESVSVTVRDRCEGCAITDLDLSPAAFDTLADPSVGRFDMTWVWAS